jgi:hypothetical protein
VGLCALLGAVLILLGAAALLRLAVLLANRLVGAPAQSAPAPKRGGIAEWDWDDWDDEGTEKDEPTEPQRQRAIPTPGLATSVAIMFLTAFVAVLAFVLLGFAAESVGMRMRRDETRLLVIIAELPILFLTLSVLLTALLPARFGRAALVAFLHLLILGGILLSLGAVVFVFAALFR